MSRRFAFERQLAWRYLRPARREGFVSVITAFSVLGITLGVATLILVTSLMNGIRAEMTTLFLGVEGAMTAYVAPQPVEEMAALAAAWQNRLAGATYVRPRLQGQLMATHQGQAMGIQLLAMYGDDFSGKAVLHNALPTPLNGVMIGEGLARALGVQPGDVIKLIAPQGQHSIAGFVPRIKSVRVAGTFKLGMHLYDRSLIVMPFDEAALLLKPPQAEVPLISELEIGIARADDAARLAAQWQPQLGDAATLLDWQRRNAGLFRALDVQRNVMLVILALIVVVAAFNLISSLIMLVQEKRGDIAILRSMGASRAQIMRAFCLSGTFIGVLGTLCGTVLGALAAHYLEPIKAALEEAAGQKLLVEQIYFLSSLPTQTDPFDVAVIALGSVLLAFLATLHPARRAASVSPAEVLRDG